MKKLLLLHNRHTPDDSDIWRAAIRRGWNTQRTDQFRVKEHCQGYDHIRYYGNTLHQAQIGEHVPISFAPIKAFYLPKCEYYTKRKIELISFESLAIPLKQTAFIKPVSEKWFEAKVYYKGERINGSPQGSDQIYVSEIVKFVDEVRCFVIDGQIMTSSLYRINSVVWDQTKEIPEKINFDTRVKDTPIPEMVRGIHELYKLPRGIVMDFGMFPSGEWALIEFNEAWASGLYYCDPEKCLDTIEESQCQK